MNKTQPHMTVGRGSRSPPIRVLPGVMWLEDAQLLAGGEALLTNHGSLSWRQIGQRISQSVKVLHQYLTPWDPSWKSLMQKRFKIQTRTIWIFGQAGEVWAFEELTLSQPALQHLCINSQVVPQLNHWNVKVVHVVWVTLLSFASNSYGWVLT